MLVLNKDAALDYVISRSLRRADVVPDLFSSSWAGPGATVGAPDSGFADETPFAWRNERAPVETGALGQIGRVSR